MTTDLTLNIVQEVAITFTLLVINSLFLICTKNIANCKRMESFVIKKLISWTHSFIIGVCHQQNVVNEWEVYPETDFWQGKGQKIIYSYDYYTSHGCLYLILSWLQACGWQSLSSFFHWLSLQAIVLFYFCQSKVKIASKNI